MSIKAMSLVFALPNEPEATPTERLVLLALADCANDKGECWPGLEHVATKTGLARRRLQRILKNLAAKNLVEIQIRWRDDGSQSSNLYRLPFCAPPLALFGGVGCHPDHGGDGPSDMGGVAPVTPPIEPSVDPSIEPKKKTPAAAPPGFEEFYAAYPKKKKPLDALKAWKQATDKPSLADLLAALEAQKASEAWTKDGGQFIPYPASWLRAGSWDDEVDNAQRSQNQSDYLRPAAEVIAQERKASGK